MPAPITEIDLLQNDMLTAALTDVLVKFIVQHKIITPDAVGVTARAAGAIAGRAILGKIMHNHDKVDDMDSMMEASINMYKVGIEEQIASALVYLAGNGAEQ